MVNAKTIINYFNQTELVPYTISQLMDLFEIYDSDNLKSLDILKMSNLSKASPALMLLCSGGASNKRGNITNKEMIDKALMLRSYTLLEFVQKFCRRIENALKNSLGMQFITKYCLQKYGSYPSQKQNDLVIDKEEIVQMTCYKRPNAIQMLRDNEKMKKSQTKKKIEGKLPLVEEDCNLSDEEEEKTQTHQGAQKKALLSIDKILNSIKKDQLNTSQNLTNT